MKATRAAHCAAGGGFCRKRPEIHGMCCNVKCVVLNLYNVCKNAPARTGEGLNEPMKNESKRRAPSGAPGAPPARRTGGGKNALLLLCNVILVLAMIATAVLYSDANQRQKDAMRLDVFCTTVESLKKVSENYLSTEKGYVDDWAAYISSQHMTADEALGYIRTTNTHADRMAHLVDLDDLSARSTVERNGVPWVHCYEEMAQIGTEAAQRAIDKMQKMLTAGPDEVYVLGKYRVGEVQRTVISVGARVTILQDDGTDKDMLLLRLIPVDYMQRSWVFPTEFPTAEISLIARDGGYIVQSPSLRSSSFLEFIRGYNFQDDYNRVNDLAAQLAGTESGLLQYRNSAGKDCYFYYSRLSVDSDVCLLGYIPAADINTEGTDWSVALIICGTLLLLVIIDGLHILSINRRLRGAVREAEKANMAKTQFLSSMSHDIRTPMNAVLGMTEIARHHLDEPDVVGDCLNKVARSGSHLLTLINDILDISKVESGRMTLTPAAFSVRGAVDELAAMIGQEASDRGLTFTLDCPELPYDVVVGDALRIRQVLINLLTNAVKYTESGGHVRFSVREQDAADDPESTQLCFVVADDGIGMSEEFQKTMYTSFIRATDSRINTIQGSGLGLAIVRQMVDLMGGTIACESAPGAGTRFTVTLTLPTAPALPQVGSSADAPEGGAEFTGMRVLVAEDNELNWEIIHILLAEHGVSSDRVENGKKCVELLERADAPAYDLVLMDVQMPVMDGREATRALRRSGRPAARTIPVVAMTADAFAEDIAACLDAGMDAHVAKPVDMDQLLRVLQAVKNGEIRRNEERE